MRILPNPGRDAFGDVVGFILGTQGTPAKTAGLREHDHATRFLLHGQPGVEPARAELSVSEAAIATIDGVVGPGRCIVLGLHRNELTLPVG